MSSIGTESGGSSSGTPAYSPHLETPSDSPSYCSLRNIGTGRGASHSALPPPPPTASTGDSLPKRGHRCWLQVCTHLRAGSDRNHDFGVLVPFTATRPRPVRASSRPFSVRSGEPLRRAASLVAAPCLTDSLQHSIRSLWLTATPMGFAPACHQIISSPHVHAMVRRSCREPRFSTPPLC